jgi:hypothetical protein
MAETFWNSLGSLRSTSAWLQWISISLVFISGLLQLGKFLVDRRERALSAIAQAELINPAAQAIQGATITVELVVASDQQINTTYMDSGGYAAFGRGAESLLAAGATQSRAMQNGKGEVLWRGVFTMDAADVAIGKPVRSLKQAEYLQIGFHQLPPDAQIKSGRALVTINNAVRLEIGVPAQVLDQGRIFVRDLSVPFSAIK